MNTLLVAKRVICNMVNLVRLVSSLRNPDIRFCVVRIGKSPSSLVFIPYYYRKTRKRSLPESKHNPQ